jgi:hypothetical protein
VAPTGPEQRRLACARRPLTHLLAPPPPRRRAARRKISSNAKLTEIPTLSALTGLTSL